MRRKALLFLVGVFVLLQLSAQQYPSLINSGSVLENAGKLYDKEDYKEALEVLNKVPRSDTNYSTILHEKAYAAYMDSSYEQSLAYARKGLEMFPEKADDWYNLIANDYDVMNKKKEALAAYDSLIQMKPHSYLAWFNKGIALYNMDRKEDAKKCIEQAILIYPHHPSSHFFLGVISADEGRLVPAMLSFTTCLMVNPKGKYAANCVRYLSNIAKVSDEIRDSLANYKNTGDDDFDFIQEILVSKIALDSKYKLKTDLEDPITRQLQVMLEKMEFNESDKGFWMQYYVPLYTELYQKNQFNTLVNFIFSGLDIKSVQSFVKKEDKKVQEMNGIASDYLATIRRTEILPYNKRTKDKEKYYLSDGDLVGIGKWHSDGKDDILTGPWEFYYDGGQLKAKGVFNENGEKEGEWSFYYDNGTMKEKSIFKNGVAQGKSFKWFSNGNLSEESFYKDDKYDGTIKSYYYNGLVKTIAEYKDDTREGKYESFTYDGFKDYIVTYKNDLPDGTATFYYKNGKVSTIKNYLQGKVDGAYKQFNEEGVLITEGNYSNDKATGEFKEYYDNKKLKATYSYVDGELDGLYTMYYPDGKTSYTLNYSGGKEDGKELIYDEEGKKYCETTYEKGRLRELLYYDKAGNLISTSTTRKGAGNLVFFDANRVKTNEGFFNKDGYRDGKSTYYFANGKLQTTANYKNGNLDGEKVIYYQDGTVSEKLNFVNGDEDGLLIDNYPNGKTSFTGNYTKGDRQQTFLDYDLMGNLASSVYYLDNDMDGYAEYYYPNGKKDYEQKYHAGWMEEVTQYDTLGNVIMHAKLDKGNGTVDYKFFSGKTYSSIAYKNYLREGKMTGYFFDGSVVSEDYYKRGLQDSISRQFYYGGKLRSEGWYTLGERTGDWKFYSPSGKLDYTQHYLKDELEGVETVYNEDGTKDKELHYLKGQLEGPCIFYGDNGELAVQLNYHNDVLVSYTYNGKDGKLVKDIPLQNATGMVTAYYKNGVKSAEINFENNTINGVRKIYCTNGKPYIDGQRLYGYDNGVKKTYFAGGTQVETVENYYYNNLNGLKTTYYQNGKIKSEENYYNDDKNGTSKYYDETGKLKETRIYFYGMLLSVTK